MICWQRSPRVRADRRRASDRKSAGSIVVVAAIASFASGHGPSAQEVSPRRTRNVEIIKRVEAGVVAVYSRNASGNLSEYGSGSVIGDGYILTNDHVIKGYRGVVLVQGMPPVEYEIVGRLPEKDLALIRVAADRPLTAIPAGRSHDLMAGEPVPRGRQPGRPGHHLLRRDRQLAERDVQHPGVRHGARPE